MFMRLCCVYTSETSVNTKRNDVDEMTAYACVLSCNRPGAPVGRPGVYVGVQRLPMRSAGCSTTCTATNRAAPSVTSLNRDPVLR